MGRLKGGGRLGLVHKESVKPYTARPTASVNNAAKQELQRHARETGKCAMKMRGVWETSYCVRGRVGEGWEDIFEYQRVLASARDWVIS